MIFFFFCLLELGYLGTVDQGTVDTSWCLPFTIPEEEAVENNAGPRARLHTGFCKNPGGFQMERDAQINTV